MDSTKILIPAYEPALGMPTHASASAGDVCPRGDIAGTAFTGGIDAVMGAERGRATTFALPAHPGPPSWSPC